MSAFGAELDRLMTARSMSARELERLTGFTDSSISEWRKDRIPPLAIADRLADVLESEELRRRAVAALTRRCVRCRRRFVASARQRTQTRYCGATCRMAAQRARDSKGKTSKPKLKFARLERAIAAFCAGCEPLGICRDSTCQLRPVSPLPWVPLHQLRRAG